MMDMEFSNGSPTYYRILGVNPDCSHEEIRRAYRKLAMQWHPDKRTRSPALLSEAKRKFQQIQEAYSVLSDHRKRTMYDAGLYDPDEEENEDFADFLQEMMSLMEDARREAKQYSMEELQTMFCDMARSFEFPDWSNYSQEAVCECPEWLHWPFGLYDSRGSSKRARLDMNTSCTVPKRNSHLHLSGLEVNGTN
ncbi:hypothetical protein RJ639_013745 [Escallonia herrerae]|uniref:J domain-containing protein n=1 Tax=Escallonia herrerae TaxID=1293975 RepID=A0AA88VKY2_9ASTE|nr:hypothetical protein RJ639_013745 [Escallonia herrerae]